MAPARNAATKVMVFQCPRGTRPMTRLSRGARPRSRVMAVLVPVSSMKTKPGRIKRSLLGAPILPRLGDVGTLLFGGMQHFYGMARPPSAA